MIKPELPANEEERLNALRRYHILDTLPEGLYDDITKIASHICQTPIALVSLIDDKRQWFKSHHGLNVDHTDKAIAYCAHAILQPDQILEVPDAFEDERFHDNPLATGAPHVRFYAGAPLIDDEGYALGTLCVIDNKAKKLSTQQKETLKALSNQVVALLKLRKENLFRKELHEQFNALVENLGDGIFELDSDGVCTYANETMSKLLRSDHNRVVGAVAWDLVHPDDLVKMKKYYISQFQKQSTQCYFEHRVKTSGNRVTWLAQNSTMVYKNGQLIKMRSIARDVSETKSLRKELKEQSSLYKLVSENSTDMIALHSIDGRYLYISPSCMDMLGYTAEELVGTNPYNLIHPEDRDRLNKGPHRSTLKGEPVQNIEYRLKRKDGTYLWVESYTKPIADEHGAVTSFQTSSRNISDKKIEQIRSDKYKEGLKLLNQLATYSVPNDQIIYDSLELITNYFGLSMGIISQIVGKEYYVRHCYTENAKTNCLKNIPIDYEKTYCSYVFKNDITLLIDHTSDFEYANHPCYQQGEVIEAYIGAVIRKNGEKYGIINFSDLKVREEKFANYEAEFIQLYVNWLGAFLESEEKRKLLELEKDRAESASLAKDNFLSMMSHEIRTPLNGIIGTTHLLLHKDPQPDQTEHLNILKQSGDNLLAIVNDILDFNKIEEGKLELDHSAFNLFELITTIYQNYLYQASDKRVTVTFQYDDTLAEAYSGDSVRISQVLHNLMSNALKFTVQGTVSLTVSQVDRHDDFDEIKFEVSDTGVGISKEKQAEIFDVFVQADKSVTREFGGSGLGLAITKRLLGLMDSEISVLSEVGDGSSFSFKLVLARQEAGVNDRIKEQQKDFAPLHSKILVVEDNPFNLAISRDFLESWSCEVVEATHGKDALKILEKRDIDLVLLDLQMPIMNGYETIQVIRSYNEKYFKDLPVIALTAAALGEEKEKVFRSGMSDFITKPFHPNEFYSKVMNHLSTIPMDRGNSKELIFRVQHKLGDMLGDPAKIESYIDLFVNTVNEEYGVLEKAIELKDLTMLRSYAHKNRSSFKLVGIDELADSAEEIQHMIDRESPEGLVLDKAKNHYDQVLKVLQSFKEREKNE